MLKQIGTALLLGLLLAGSALAQAPQIGWENDYDAAMKRAQSEKKPVFIIFLMDNEPANDEIAKVHLHEPDIVKLSAEFVCLIANSGMHADGVPVEGPAGTAHACAKYGAVSCAQHQQVERHAREEFMNSPVVAAPQFLFLAPDGKSVILRHVWTIGPAELLRKMRIALGLIDPTKGGDLVHAVQAATDEMLKQANDNNMNKRRDALKALATSEDPRVIDFLIKQTAETVDESKRLEAIEAMGERGNGRVLPVLLKLLGASSGQIRLAVAKSLDRLGMPESAPSLFAALKKETRSGVRGGLVRALVTADANTPEFRKFIIGMIKGSTQGDAMHALRAAGRMKADDELKKAIIAASKGNSPSVRGAAYWALGMHKVTEAGTAIAKAAETEKNTDVKNLALGAVARINNQIFEGPDSDSCLSNLFSTAGLNN